MPARRSLKAAFGCDHRGDHAERKDGQSHRDDCQSLAKRIDGFVREEDGQTHGTDDQDLRGLRG